MQSGQESPFPITDHYHPMKLNALRDFVAVAERGSLRAAARQLGVAQPAITRNIRELEKELGVTLFERQPTGVVLSPMGAVFLRRAQAVRSELRRAQDELDQLHGASHGQLRVCLSTVPHMALLPYALTAFRLRYPDVRIEIVDALLPRVEQELADGTLDCYIGPTLERTSSALAQEKLFDIRRIVIGRKGHPLAGARSLAELVEAEWITSSLTYQDEDEISPVFAHHGLPPPRLVIKAGSALTFLQVLAHSDLLMLLPPQWADTPPFSDALQRIDVAEALSAPPICIVYRSGLPLTPAAEYFCDMMRRASSHLEAGTPPAPHTR